jgi:hypothetical protein
VGDVTSRDRKQLAKIASNATYAEPGYILFIRNRTLMVQPFNTAKLETTGGAVPVAEQLSFDMSNVAAISLRLKLVFWRIRQTRAADACSLPGWTGQERRWAK